MVGHTWDPSSGEAEEATCEGKVSEMGSQSAPSGERLSQKQKARAMKVTPLVKTLTTQV